jgi:MFS family permease
MQSNPPTTGGDPGRPNEQHAGFGFRFVAPLALGAVLNPINSTMISTALVPIATDFHASVAEAGWLIAGLYLASAVAQPTMGRLADLFGPRRIYLISLFIVAISALVGRFAPTLGVLIAVRVALGIGTAGAYPSAMRIFRVQADRLGAAPPRVAMSVLSLAGVSTLAIGPLLGGLLTGAFGWHSIFAVNTPLALLAALLVLLWVPKDQPRDGGFARLMAELDVVGILLFTGFLLGLMIFLMNLDRPVWSMLPIAAVLGVALVLHSARRKQPFIDVRMLARNRPLTVTYLRAGAVLMIVYCILYGFAQWLESGAGFSTSQAGLITMPMSLLAAVSSVTGGRTKGIRGPFIVSIGAALAGCICLFFIDSSKSAWIIAAAVVCFGVPQGIFSTATQTAVYLQAPADEIGTAAGLQRTAGYLGAIAATSLLGALYGKTASDHGLHSLAIVMGVLSACLFVATIFDRTIPRIAAV